LNFNALGPYLRRLREGAELDSLELGRRTGVAPSRIDAIEAGATDTTFLEVVLLARAFRESVDDIWAAVLGGEEVSHAPHRGDAADRAKR
jgi:transcriptional regulator with XRE-family HTH domain